MSPQLDLFGDVSAAAHTASVTDCPGYDSEIARLASRLPASIRLGSSSWAHPGLGSENGDRVRPEPLIAGRDLAAFARHPLVRTVSLDWPYYAAVEEAVYRHQAEQVRGDFRFLVTAPRSITSPYLSRSREPSPTFLDARAARSLFIDRCMEGLGNSAGPLVFKFPPLRRAFTRESGEFASRIARFFRDLPEGPLYAAEFRDREMLGADIMRALAESGVRLCLSVHARMPAVEIQAAAATSLGRGDLVVRWNHHSGFGHDETEIRASPFDRLLEEDPVTRVAIARLCRESASRGDESWVMVSSMEEGLAPLERLARVIVDGGARDAQQT